MSPVSTAKTRTGGSIDYAAIAAKKMRDPGTRHPRYLIYGRNKQGKTGMLKDTPNLLVIDPENGSHWLPSRPDLKVWPVNNWADINPAFRYLELGNHPFEFVAIDGLTRIHNMALRFVMKQQEERDLDRIPGQVQQRDYGKANELMKGMLYNFHSLDLGVIFTAQDRMDTGGFSDSEDDDDTDVEARFVPDLPKGVRSAVNGLVDAIGRIYTVQAEVTSKKTGNTVKVARRRLWLAPSDKYDTGFRSEHYKGVPPYLTQPSIPRLSQLLATGKV